MSNLGNEHPNLIGGSLHDRGLRRGRFRSFSERQWSCGGHGMAAFPGSLNVLSGHNDNVHLV